MKRLLIINAALLALTVLAMTSLWPAQAQYPCDRGSEGRILSSPQWVPGDGKGVPDQSCRVLNGIMMCW